MAKNTSISNDVDFIKEFEELKLKQKLLIESLTKKNISQQNQLFLEINSKLDFLVKIFKDANESDSKAEEQKLESHFKEVLEKFDLVGKNIDLKLEDLSKKNIELQEEIKIIKEKLSTPVVSLSTPVLNPQSVIPTPEFKIKTPEAKSISTSQNILPSVIQAPVNIEEKKIKKVGLANCIDKNG